MNRRTFSTISALSLPLLIAGSSFAQHPGQVQPIAKPAAAKLSAAQVAANVDAFYKGVGSFSAQFRQRYTNSAHGISKDDAGSVIFQKPGKMSWRYTSNGNRVVSDGTTLKVYEKNNQQMLQQPLTGSSYPAALSFLTGHGSLAQSFTFSIAAAAQAKFPSGYVLLGIPTQQSPGVTRVYFFVDGNTFIVRRVIIEDAQQNKNRFEFEKARVNKPPPPNEFTFTPPPGTQLLRP